MFSPLWSGVFLNVIRSSKRMKILLYSVSFCPQKHIQFSKLLSRGKGKNVISCFLTSLTHQVEFFLLIFFDILAIHLLNLK